MMTTLQKNLVKHLITLLIASLLFNINTIASNPPCYDLVWSDEFSGNTLDQNKWQYYTWGWDASNVQNCYQQDNVAVNNGTLKLTARYEPGVTCSSGGDFSSGFVETRDRASWTYGYFEARVKLPASNSTWPSFWMSPQDSEYGSWPRSGEVDVFEVKGHDMTRSYGNAHWGNSTSDRQQEKGTYTFPASNNADNWHIYAVEWNEGELKFYIDDVHYHTINNFDEPNAAVHPGPFDKDFFLRFNVAVGGTYLDAPWDNAYNAINQLPATMEVDWVRVYQKNNNCNPDLNETDCNLIQNADFSAGQSPWQTYISSSASASLNTNASYADFTITNGSTSKYKVQLFQSGLLLEQGKTYEISFRAKADANKSIYVQFSDQNDPPTQYHYQDFNVGTNWSTQSFTYTMNNATNSNARINFGVGSNSIDIAFDDILVKEQDCVPVLSTCNEVENSDFSAGQQLWETDIHASANASLNTNFGYADFTITNGSDSRSKVKLFQTGLNLQQGKTYNISFIAKADANKAIYVKLSDENESVTQYDWEDFNVGTNWNTYSYSYTMNFASDNTARISFGVGDNAIDIAIDDVVVEEQNCDSPTVIYGCTEQCAPNYDPTAEQDDGSCQSCPPPPNTCNSNARMADPAKTAVESAFAKFAQASFTNNFIRAEKAYIKHQKEIHYILSSKEKKYYKVNADFEAVKGIALSLLYTTFTKFGESITISSNDIHLLNEFLTSLSKATDSQLLKDEIENIQKYMYVMDGKEVKRALVDFDQAGEEDAKDLTVIEDRSDKEVKAFPNPFTDKIIIALGKTGKDEGLISIFSAAGILVYKQSFDKIETLEINSKNWDSGMYILQVSNGEKTYTKKLLK